MFYLRHSASIFRVSCPFVWIPMSNFSMETSYLRVFPTNFSSLFHVFSISCNKKSQKGAQFQKNILWFIKHKQTNKQNKQKTNKTKKAKAIVEDLTHIRFLYDSLWAGRSGDRIPVVARFSALVQTDPGAHPASYTMGTVSLAWG